MRRESCASGHSPPLCSSVLLTVDFLLCREDYQLALNRRWGGCDKNIGDRKMNCRMKIFFSLIFLSPIFLSPVFLRPGFNQWVAGEARAGSSMVKNCLTLVCRRIRENSELSRRKCSEGQRQPLPIAYTQWRHSRRNPCKPISLSGPAESA